MNLVFEPSPEQHRKGLNALMRAFTPFQRMLLYVFTLLLGLSSFVLLAQANMMFSTAIPAPGGSFTEGVVGTPRFINPLLASSQADLDLTTLVYSGLMRETNGVFSPDLAESYEISHEGTVYTFHLKKNLEFHDGNPLTANDVLYTISLAQNPDIKSVRRADWDGVRVEAKDEHTVIFTLPSPYTPFLENTTMGILPKAVWENTPIEEFAFSPLNTHPIGSGPYEIENATFDTTGAPTKYEFHSFNGFALGEPHITRIEILLYANDEGVVGAFTDGDIDSFVSSSPKAVPSEMVGKAHPLQLPLRRVFGVFLNQNHASVLADASVRKALAAAVDRNALVADVLGGYGSVLDGPIPPGLIPLAASSSEATTTIATQSAQTILSRGGWKLSAASSTDTSERWTKNKVPLSLKLATADTPELIETAELITAAWRAIGVTAETDVYPLQEFNQTILRPRAYDAILFGEVVGPSLDLFPFWHSSQRNDPGLNLSLYANATADKALSDARVSTDAVIRKSAQTLFLETLASDTPAIFLYAPHALYLAPAHVQGISIGSVTNVSERFATIHTWYRDTERVWDVFLK